MKKKLVIVSCILLHDSFSLLEIFIRLQEITHLEHAKHILRDEIMHKPQAITVKNIRKHSILFLTKAINN